jgi:hypothetical protein
MNDDAVTPVTDENPQRLFSLPATPHASKRQTISLNENNFHAV